MQNFQPKPKGIPIACLEGFKIESLNHLEKSFHLHANLLSMSTDNGGRRFL